MTSQHSADEGGGGSERIYRLLLLLYPRKFRLAYRSEMIEAFRYKRTQATSAVRFWGWLLLRDLVPTVLHAWRSTRTATVGIRGSSSKAKRRDEQRLQGGTVTSHDGRGALLTDLARDIQYSIRTLVRTPGVTVLTILILAMGIGANTAILSVFKAVFLEPLPLPQPEELTFIWNTNARRGGFGPSSFPDFLDWQAQNRTLEAMGAFGGTYLNLTEGDEPVRIRGAHATSSVFDVLGVQPALGRAFLPEEDLSGIPVVLLSHTLWKERFGAETDIVGSTIGVNGAPHTVIGVMPEGFVHPTPWGFNDPYQAWIPLRSDAWVKNRNSYSYQVIARLRDGVSIGTAQADLDQVSIRLEDEYPVTNVDQRAWVVPLHGLLFGEAGFQIILLLLAAGAVLLIACGNIASFQLARANSRRVEMAVRASLGASRGRVIRQLLTESTMIALAGGFAAVFLAYWSLGLLKALLPPTIPRTGDIRLDAIVLIFAAAISLGTGVLFGLAPALAASRTQLTEVLKEGQKTVQTGWGRLRMQNAFVIAQFALGLVLANAGLLLIQSYATLTEVDQGFDREQTLTMALSLDGERYDEGQERQAFYDELMPRLEAIPGVTSAAATSKLPLLGGTNGPSITEERYAQDPNQDGILTELSVVVGNYFQAMGIPLLAGRTLLPEDADTVNAGVVINETAARRFWPGEDPLGKRFGFGGDPPSWLTVVGVVGDVRQWGAERAPRPEVYTDYRLNSRTRMLLTLSADGDPATLIGPAREAVLSVDPLQPVSEVTTMGQILSAQLSGREFYTLLITLFSLLALVLAAAGIYGVMSYFVVRRTRELGIRLALGAGHSGVVSLVVRRALWIVGFGLLLGMGGIFVSTRIIGSLLYNIRPLNVPTILYGVGFLMVVGVVASLIPAFRTTRISPVTALRME
jgi:putative ABC transport system permease protein